MVDYHVHRTMDETIYVVEGEIEFAVVGETYLRPAGSVAFIPRGHHHGFRNRGPARARVLILFTPSEGSRTNTSGSWRSSSPRPTSTRRP